MNQEVLEFDATFLKEPPKPFLRWAGGKRRLMPILHSRMPKDFQPGLTKVYEVFLGGGAFIFSLFLPDSQFFTPGSKVHINDVNEDLILAYKVVRSSPQELMEYLQSIARTKSKAEFERVKASRPRSDIGKAARLIYLNRTCFNGLWRVNSSGEFNVPWGTLKNPQIFNRQNLISCSARLKGAKITNWDYTKVLESCMRGEFVYLDPPYLPGKSGKMFSQYAKAGFGISHHIELSDLIIDLTRRGVRVMLSNSDSPLTRQIYGPAMDFHKLRVMRSISAASKSRIYANEVIGTNY